MVDSESFYINMYYWCVCLTLVLKYLSLSLSHTLSLTHGFMTGKKKVSATSVYFESMAYHVNVRTHTHTHIQSHSPTLTHTLIITHTGQ